MSKDTYKYLQENSLKSIFERLKFDYHNHDPLRIVIFGYFGMRNIGDDAILETEINELRELNYTSSIYAPSRYPEVVRKQFGIKSSRFGNFPKLIRELFRANLFIFGGGGLFCSTNSSSYMLQFSDFMFTVYKTLFFLIIPKLLGKTVIVYGVGYYNNQNWLNKSINLLGLSFADYISVRDTHSFTSLRKTLKNKKVYLHKDVAFSLAKKTSNKIDLEKFKIKKNNKNIAISLIPFSDEVKFMTVFDSLIELIKTSDKKTHFYFLPYFTNPDAHNDLNIAHKMAEILGSQNLFTIVDPSIGPKGYLELFSHMQGAVCMRFHAQVFAYIKGVPMLGISYDKKCESFLNDTGTDYINLRTTTNDNVKASLEKFIVKYA